MPNVATIFVGLDFDVVGLDSFNFEVNDSSYNLKYLYAENIKSGRRLNTDVLDSDAGSAYSS